MKSLRARRGAVALPMCLAVAGALATVAAPANAADTHLAVHQAWSATVTPEGTPLSVTYSWPGGGAALTVDWGDGSTNLFRVPTNSRTASHSWDVPCNVAQKTFTVKGTVAKGNGDSGQASIGITVERVGPPCT